MKSIVICQYALFSNSLCSLIKEYDKNAHVYEATQFQSALSEQENSEPYDLIVLYMNLTKEGWAILEQLHAGVPNVPILVVGDFEESDQIRTTISRGANGCVSTSFTWRTVSHVISRILKGEIVCPPINFEVEADPEENQQPAQISNSSSEEITDLKLTKRQTEVLRLIHQGRSNKEIARELDMALPTVKIHCAAIFRELGVNNRTQAAIEAAKLF
ncbi:MAG: DNA-binding response regulator [Gammaproteobacteria bacterium]